jgi:hypothetical protein
VGVSGSRYDKNENVLFALSFYWRLYYVSPLRRILLPIVVAVFLF